jgi:hypothetical protein
MHALEPTIYNTRPSDRRTGVLRARHTVLLECLLLTGHNARER